MHVIVTQWYKDWSSNFAKLELAADVKLMEGLSQVCGVGIGVEEGGWVCGMWRNLKGPEVLH